MTHDEKLQKIKQYRKRQEQLVLKVKRIRRYPAPQSTRIAIKRAMAVIQCMIEAEQIQAQIMVILQTPRPKLKKGGIFSEGVAIIQQTGEKAFLLSRLNK